VRKVIEQKAEVVRLRVFALQVCVPSDWTKEQIEDFANRASPTGIQSKWYVRTDDEAKGDPQRVPCSKPERAGFVHVVMHY
jgi:hypothetical protein